MRNSAGKLLALILIATAAPVAAQTTPAPTPIRLSCDFGSVVDVWVINVDQSKVRFAGWPEPGIPATITDDAFIWEYQDHGGLAFRYYINRYTGVADVQTQGSNGYRSQYSGRCQVVQERAF